MDKILKKEKLLSEAIGLKKGETIVVVGAGGKSTFCLSLCDELKYNNRVIFTTSTKMFLPKLKEKYHICLGKGFLAKKLIENGAYIAARKELPNHKVLPYEIKKIDSLKENGDYLIIEGDGSKMKPLKGWNETEPVFVERTDKTIGIISIKALDLKINEENIHRLDKFLEISKGVLEERVNITHLYNVVNNENGLFKDSKGRKVLLINQVESIEDYKNLSDFIKFIKEKKINIDKIVISSLHEKKYYSVY